MQRKSVFKKLIFSYLIFFGILALLMLPIGMSFSEYMEKTFFKAELTQEMDTYKDDIINALGEENKAVVENSLKSMISENKDYDLVALYDSKGQLILSETRGDLTVPDSDQDLRTLKEIYFKIDDKNNLATVFEYYAPIKTEHNSSLHSLRIMGNFHQQFNIEKQFVITLWGLVGLTLLFSLGGVFLVSSRIFRPLKQLALYCKEIETGNIHACPLPQVYHSDDEVGELAATLVNTTNQLTGKIEDLSLAKRQLEDKVNMLDTIFEVSQIMNSPYVDRFYETITYAIGNYIKGTVLCSIWLYNEENKAIYQASSFTNANDLPIDNFAKVAQNIVQGVFHSRQIEMLNFSTDKEFAQDKMLQEYKVISLPLLSSDEILGVLIIWQKKSDLDNLFSSSRLQLYSTLAKSIAIVMENKNLYTKMLGSIRLKQELETAKTIQASFSRSVLNTADEIFYTKSLPASEVGGDYVDIIPTVDGKSLIAIADVSGKGVPAALLSASLHFMIKIVAKMTDAPEACLKITNSVLYEDLNHLNMFITASLALFDSGTRRLVLSSAGHCYPIWYQAESGLCQKFMVKGIIIGAIPNATYAVETVQLQKGDAFIFYTDGIIDAVNSLQEHFGFERLRKVIQQCAQLDGDEIKSAIFHAINRFTGNEPQKDDMTLVVLKVKE